MNFFKNKKQTILVKLNLIMWFAALLFNNSLIKRMHNIKNNYIVMC